MKDPLDRSQRELNAARRALSEMRAARSFADYEKAWQDCLGRIEKAWNKTQKAYLDGSYTAWRGRHEHLRTSDQLLHYLKQCRDAEEHTIGETIAREGAALGIGPSSGTSLHIEHMTVDRGKITIDGATPGIAITFLPERAKLLPAVSRGVITPPPKEHLGIPFDSTDPVVVAKAGVAYYYGMINSARVEFGPKHDQGGR